MRPISAMTGSRSSTARSGSSRRPGAKASKIFSSESPAGIAVGANGYVYVADQGNHRVQMLTESLGYFSQFGKEGRESGQSAALTASPSQQVANVYVVDTADQRVAEWKPTQAKSGCTDESVGPNEGSWQTAGNWSTGDVPSASDTACIESGDKVQVTTFGNHAARLLDEGTLEIARGASSRSADRRLQRSTIWWSMKVR